LAVTIDETNYPSASDNETATPLDTFEPTNVSSDLGNGTESPDLTFAHTL